MSRSNKPRVQCWRSRKGHRYESCRYKVELKQCSNKKSRRNTNTFLKNILLTEAYDERGFMTPRQAVDIWRYD